MEIMAAGVDLGSAAGGVDELSSPGPRYSINGRPDRPRPRRATAETRERWRINPDRSTLNFSVGHQILGGLRGKFHCWGGLLLLDRSDLRRSAIRFWVDLSSFDTGSAKLDERIAATELFDVEREPALVFDGESVQLRDAGHGVVVGRLAVHCVDREAVVSIEGEAPRRDASGVWHLVYNARVSIDLRLLHWRKNRSRSSWLGHLVWGDAVQIVAHVEVMRDVTAPAPVDVDVNVNVNVNVPTPGTPAWTGPGTGTA